MTRTLSPLACVLVALCAAGSAVSAAQRRILPPGAALLGQVVDAESGVGLRRAVIEIDGAGLRRRLVSDDRGRFLFTGLPAGDFYIRASRTGYLNGAHGQRRPSGAATAVTVTTGQWIGPLDVPLWKPGVITGDVRDVHGDPAVGVNVRAYRREHEGGRTTLREAAAAVTDDAGRYRLTPLVPGDHVVGMTSLQLSGAPPSFAADTDTDDIHVFAPQYYPAADMLAGASSIPVVAGREFAGVNFLLPAGAPTAVSGRLVVPETLDEAGDPIVLVLSRPADPTVIESPSHRVLGVTSADADGRFTFPEVPAGQYDIEAVLTGMADGLYWARETITVTDTGLTEVVVTLRAGLDVEGRIRLQLGNRQGTPQAANVQISFDPLFHVPGIREFRAEVDDTGSFRTGRTLPPGPYLVRVAPPQGFMVRTVMSGGRDISDHPLDLSSGFSATDVEVLLTDQRTSVIGTVRGEGPFGDPTATVLLMPSAPGTGQHPGSVRRFRSVRTTREGTFTIRDIPPGAYLAVAIDDAEAEGWQEPTRLERLRRRATPVSVREGEAKVIELRRMAAR